MQYLLKFADMGVHGCFLSRWVVSLSNGCHSYLWAILKVVQIFCAYGYTLKANKERKVATWRKIQKTIEDNKNMCKSTAWKHAA